MIEDSNAPDGIRYGCTVRAVAKAQRVLNEGGTWAKIATICFTSGKLHSVAVFAFDGSTYLYDPEIFSGTRVILATETRNDSQIGQAIAFGRFYPQQVAAVWMK